MDFVFENFKRFCSESIVMLCSKLKPPSILSRVFKPAFSRARKSLINFMNDSNVVHRKSKNAAHPPALVDLDIRHKFSEHQVSDLYQKFLSEIQTTSVQHLQSICDGNYLQIGIKEFLKLEEMRVNPFAARICMVFSEDGTGKLDFQKFLNVTLTFSRQTPAERKMIWIYALWDFDGDDILGEDDIMQGIELLTSTGVAVQPMKQFLQRVGSSEGLHSVEMEGLFKKVSNEVDPEDDGISFMNFRGLLMRMPDLLTNFDIFTT